MESISSDWHLLNSDDCDSTGSPMSEDESCMDQLEAMAAEADTMNCSLQWRSSQSQSGEYLIEQHPQRTPSSTASSTAASIHSWTTSSAQQSSICGGNSVFGPSNSTDPMTDTFSVPASEDVDSCGTDSEDVCGIDFVRIRDGYRVLPHISGHEFSDSPTGCDDVVPALDKTKAAPSNTTDDIDKEKEARSCDEVHSSVSIKPESSAHGRVLDAIWWLFNGWSIVGDGQSSFVSGRSLVAFVMVALISVAVGSLIVLERKNAEIEMLQHKEAMREMLWMHQMEERIAEQLRMFNSQMQAERDSWENQLQNSNSLMEELKAKLSQSEALNKVHQVNEEISQSEQNTERSILGWYMGSSEDHFGETYEENLDYEMNQDQLVEELSNKYSISTADKVSLQQILEKHQGSNHDKTQDSHNGGSSWDDPETVMTQSLAATKAFLENSLRSLQKSIKDANFTTEALSMSSEQFVNISEVIRVSELMGNAVFDLVAEKISQITELKENLDITQVEQFATAQAKNTVQKMNSIVNKTVEKLSKVRDEMESNKQIKKLRKGAGKIFNDFMKNAGNNWKDFSKMVSRMFFKNSENDEHSKRSDEDRFDPKENEKNFMDDENERRHHGNNDKPFWKKKLKEERHENRQHFDRVQDNKGTGHRKKHRNN